MNRQIEELYSSNDSNLENAIQSIENPQGFILEFNQYLQDISVIPEIQTEKNMLGRKRYCSNRTVEIIVAITECYGQQYPNEVVKLITGLGFMVVNKVCERINLFEYLLSHKDNVEQNPDYLNTLFNSYFDCQEAIFGQKLLASVGTKGIGYDSTFFNNLYSNWGVSVDGDIAIDFRLEIHTFHYKMEEIASRLGVKKFGRMIDEINQHDLKRRKQPLPLSSIPLRSSVNDKKLRDNMRELSLKLNESIQSEHPHIHASIGEFFSIREDVDTDYFITLHSQVKFTNDYDEVKEKLIQTIKDLYEIEQKTFGCSFMMEESVQTYKEFKKELTI